MSGNEALALAATHAGITLGTGYPGTPSTEILENFSLLGGNAQWAPNEKVALEVGIGVAFAGGRSLVTMKHVGVNVAADPLFTAAYTGVTGALVLVAADDPGMASSQNEQDSRQYARAAAVPMLEPSDSQEAYDFLFTAIEISERWNIPVMFRMTTRVCHSKTVVHSRAVAQTAPTPHYERDLPHRVMIPAYARPAHRRLREKLRQIAEWCETSTLNRVSGGDDAKTGIIAAGIVFAHVREAAPNAPVLKLGMTHPLPYKAIRAFAESVERCVIIEDGDPYLEESIRAQGIAADTKQEMYRYGELSVQRVQRILNNDVSPEPAPVPGKPPQLCMGCPHRVAFSVLSRMGCIVSGDIGCYTLGVLPPFEGIDTCVCMGASIGVGLGLRHALPEDEARRVVSVIGDSTFVHSGLTGIVEMVYNKPSTGHLLIILDNGTTAMTGMQEHPGTGRKLDHSPGGKLNIEAMCAALGMERIHTVDPTEDPEAFERLVKECLASGEVELIVARKPCKLAEKRIASYEAAAAQPQECESNA
ncbi:MAG: thiamine pyrophosphate-dependent enzyme [FCB group bacterium]|jgi:indolepyruvate ferredoxin oxidoreductase alpha subunit|nr:thiamine pyrophosphate-dependent enzyme [FCB group bacterium]